MSTNEAAWLLKPKGDLRVFPAAFPVPSQDEIVINNQAFAIQPLDATVLGEESIDVPYPAILGNGVAGIVEEAGGSVTKFKKGDRVISDTPSYQLKQTKYGGWQKYVVGREATTVHLAKHTTFDDAAVMPFALLTAVAALKLKLGMDKPGTLHSGKALIWSASGSVGGYAVQYAASVGYEVVTTASPRKFDYVRGLGANEVLDYNDDHIVLKLRDLGPYEFVMSASGDVKGANAISDILQPFGGEFASTHPKTEAMQLAPNVSLLYDLFSMATQKKENEGFTNWWYEDYLPLALAGGVKPTPLEKRSGGLYRVQEACDDILGGRNMSKIVLNPQASFL
ncbi:unnamed protein product [Penicillium pancosmium]